MSMQLYHGDCLEVMPTLADNSVDLVLTDPPYGTTACKWDSIIPLEPMWEQLKRIAKPNAAIVMTASQPFTTTLIASNMKMFKYCWVWRKPQGVDPFMAKHRPLNNVEDVVVFCGRATPYYPQFGKGVPYSHDREKKNRRYQATNTLMRRLRRVNNGKRFPTRVLEINRERGLHPTQKPVALMEYMIKTYTNEGETVLDFTAGSFTTGVACINTNRKFIGIERDDHYFSIGSERMRARHLEIEGQLNAAV